MRVSVVERTRMWAENKQKKIEMLKEATVDKDIDECTFQPKIQNHRVVALSHHNLMKAKRKASVDEADQTHK